MYFLRSLFCGAAFFLALALPLYCGVAPGRTTYVITDGSRVLVHTTDATDPAAVLGEAGLELSGGDTYTTRSSAGTAEIRIRRSQTIYIDYYGERIQTCSTGETVDALLSRLHLNVDSGDLISASRSSRTHDGMKLTVARVLRQEQTYSAVIPHDTCYCTDPTLPAGTEKVLIPGVDGELRCTAMVTYVNHEETERKVLDETVTRQPVAALIAVGTAVSTVPPEKTAPVITDTTITLPTGEVLTYDGVITSLATAYCDKGLTATGTQARVGAIAVDPRVIPYGTRMFIMSADGEYVYGIATAEDCGNLEHIVGTRIDLHFDTYAQCRAFGARDCLVYFLS